MDLKRDAIEPRGPSLDNEEKPPNLIKPQHRLLHDPHVTFEEYIHYARLTREEEKETDRLYPEEGRKNVLRLLFPSKSGAGVRGKAATRPDGVPEQEPRRLSRANLADQNARLHVSDEEWKNASRALRTATWASCFYLITTDILGPFGVGFSMGTLGWGPGIALFTAFGIMAGYSGYLLWKMYLGMDS